MIVGTPKNPLTKAVVTSTHNLCFEQKYENYQNFLPKIFPFFLLVKFSTYLNKRAFVMLLLFLILEMRGFLKCLDPDNTAQNQPSYKDYALCHFLLSCNVRKHGVCAQQRLRSACAAIQSELSLLDSLWTSKNPAKASFMKTCLFKYIENFTSKNWNFSDKKLWYFSDFCSKHKLWVIVRTAWVGQF